MLPNKTIIKCPICGAKLGVVMTPDITKKSVTCPICHERSPFSRFAILSPNPSSAQQKPYTSNDDTVVNNDDTVINKTHQGTMFKKVEDTLGQLMLDDGRLVSLHLGENTIGRAVTPPQAQTIFDDPSKRMSRKHAKIVVEKTHNGEYRHKLMNWQNQNPTLVDGVPLEDDDIIILHNGNIIDFASVRVRFVRQGASDDSDATEYRHSDRTEYRYGG